ncbi:Probable WRKY transcription factor 50 [Striga hermonthica]|uniref:Probable WRKY transcription factor 50 n=1 Tax=Striga hermonthica TaxID=68872 RepID=A0A9N7R9E5_STRHE|nr:Probable WRKY transcription factor 50 [Striga hermonthica]
MAEYYQNYAKAPLMNAPNNESAFDVSDFFEFNNWAEHVDPTFSSMSAAGCDDMNPHIDSTYMNEVVENSSWIGDNNNLHEEIAINNMDNGIGKKERRERVAFKTKSEVEVLDDGFKWRKYGKKMVKNSPNPRNYYKCSVDGCPVKKQVERCKEDPRYVVTTYDGVHNHKGPHS